MATLPENMIATAELLANFSSPLGSAALRRSVSTAYYALFSRLAGLCACLIARSARTTDSFKAVYRSLDHGQARNALYRHAEFGVLGDAFKRLQEARHWADNSVDSHPEAAKAADGARFTRSEAREFVELARQTMATVDALSKDAKQRLAVALIARSRR